MGFFDSSHGNAKWPLDYSCHIRNIDGQSEVFNSSIKIIQNCNIEIPSSAVRRPKTRMFIKRYWSFPITTFALSTFERTNKRLKKRNKVSFPLHDGNEEKNHRGTPENLSDFVLFMFSCLCLRGPGMDIVGNLRNLQA
uniref:Uncharacterized protein n=1 Tax=Megaselia scalaris TaxID=36166 RepID=T1GWC9_MEGSC